MPSIEDISQRAAFIELLKWFAEKGRESRAGTQASDVVATQSAMAVPYPRVSDFELPRRLNAFSAASDLVDWIYGPEVGKAGSESIPIVVPAITASWSWSTSKPSIQVIVALLIAGNTAQTGLMATAFRFESPDQGTSHDYYHAQPTSRKVHRGEHLGGVRLPIHESMPAFPLDAIGPVGLVMCVLMALYGVHWIREMFAESEGVRTAVRPYLAEMPAFSARRAEIMGPGSSGIDLSGRVPGPRNEPIVPPRDSGGRKKRR